MTRINAQHVLVAGVVSFAASLRHRDRLAQTVALKRLMDQKLEHSQAVLAAVTTSRWEEMQCQLYVVRARIAGRRQ
jgi:hypothetical protein